MVFSVKNASATMLDRPEPRTVAAGISYWFFCFLVFPFIMVLFSQDEGQALYGAWLDIGYHLFNFVVVIAFFFRYLRESFLMVQVDTKKFLKTVAIGTVAVVALKTLICVLFISSTNEVYANAAWGHLVTTELDLAYYSTALLGAQPLWGTLCLVLLSPVVTSCLLYACVFAPICNNRPWLAYVVMTVAFLIIQLMMIFCLWSADAQIAGFVVQIPIHLIACWTYQRTDTIWTPVAVHTLSNLLLSLLAMLHMGVI